MKELINRLKRWLQGEDEEETKYETESSPVPVMNRDLTIRTANIYPKKTNEKEKPQRGTVRRVPPRQQTERKNADRFKFPLIPDEPAAVTKQQVSQLAAPVKKVEEPAVHRQVVKKEGKRSFQPTEVISPIYGRKRPETLRKTESERIEASQEKFVIPEGPIIAREQRSAEAIANPVPYEAPSGMEIQKSEVEKVEMEKSEPQPPLSDIRIEKQAERVNVRFEDTKEETLEDNGVQSGKEMEEPEEPGAAEPVSSGSSSGYIPSYLSALSGQVSGEDERPVQPFYRQSFSYSYNEKALQEEKQSHQKPSVSLLKNSPPLRQEKTDNVRRQEEVLATTLQNFNVNAEVIGAVQGPTVTRYEIQPAAGVKVNKITNLIDDIKLSLAARDIRIEAPIPGRSAVGIEVPNEESMPVYLRKILESPVFISDKSPLAVALGVDIGGEPVVSDLSKMPHGLIAGATGSGKSVCINSIIISLLYKASPEEVRLLLIDPKMVELAPYNRLPHLITPVVTDPKQATAALKWAVQEMDSRYEKFAEAGARDISRYNELMRRNYPDEKEYVLPSIVIIIDELADLMMVAPQDVEESICRIAQKARACGIHLLVATQRPSVDVITGLIKANIPTRVAFSVSSQTDSRTILDMNGAERLLGRGDMLYLSSGSSKPVRLQGPYVSDEEIEAVTEFARSQGEPNYLFEKEDLNQVITTENSDGLFAEALLFCVENGQASASLLQRQFRVGYNRAARLIDMMEEKGFISGHSGSSKPRDVFLSHSDYEKLFLSESK
ncbi:DNA translocase FtsK [Aneurinibacillus tyrosinisolvens]|uniref:DNA translocase FtsK n=1 Tax=Aneurinibacillus tyrosinisolvens TaxID=1443435 RepID=UPI000B3206FC|nr:DNA translocase FtsK [Aneurinibacillus tyrosinisolvens]